MGKKWSGCNGNVRDPRGDESIMYLDCININILVVILYCRVLLITMRENQAKGIY